MWAGTPTWPETTTKRLLAHQFTATVLLAGVRRTTYDRRHADHALVPRGPLGVWPRPVAHPPLRGVPAEDPGELEPGDTSEEFLEVGCCGDALEVTLRATELEGGGAVGPDTDVEWRVHEACDVAGGWRVQSASGPTA